MCSHMDAKHSNERSETNEASEQVLTLFKCVLTWMQNTRTNGVKLVKPVSKSSPYSNVSLHRGITLERYYSLYLIFERRKRVE